MTTPERRPPLPPDDAWQHLAGRARTLFYLQAFTRLGMFWLPVSLGIGVALTVYVSLAWGVGVGVALMFLRMIIALWWPALQHDRWTWSLRDGDLLLARGVLFRSITAIPLQRIQHVDLRQGPLEQWMRLGRVQVFTASGMGADGVLPGLDVPVAEALRDHLVAAGGDDGV